MTQPDMLFAVRDVPSALPDQAARDTVVRALDETLLVEAGAGSGKTTLMVQRLLALLERGTAPGAIAAVTFTRKAATELRERLAQSLEERIASPTTAAEARATLARARDELDRAYVGTIHGFCSRLLREQALAAGLSPDFVELDEETAKMEGEAMLITAVDAAREQGAWGADALQVLGIEPRELVSLALRLDGQPDVRFDVADAPPPDAAAFIAALDVLMEQAVALLPTTAPEKGWDSFQRLVHRWQVARAAFDASQPLAVVQFAELLESKTAREIKVTRWRSGKSAQVPIKALEADVESFFNDRLTPFLQRWRAHCHGPVVRFAQSAAAAWRAHRAERDWLTFEDLLQRTADLLRSRPAARAQLGERWQHLLVDEFQDTDPLQAELCLLLASDRSSGTDWRTVTPRPGALFVVGDPKQSIYRFRRADIQTYEFVRARFAQFGRVVRLVANFRSTRAIADAVNAHFTAVFAPEGATTTTQAPFAPLVAQRDGMAGQGIMRHEVPAASNKGGLFAADAELVASAIATAIAEGRARPEDFLVLTWRTHELRYYAEALAMRNVPASTSGAKSEIAPELQALRDLLHALAMPTDEVAVVAALEGLCFGCTPAQLHAARTLGASFMLERPPHVTRDEADNETRAMAAPVIDALHTLHAWWRLAGQMPPAALVDRLLDETGLLPLAASQVLGDRRAGALLGLAESLRRVAMQGDDLVDLLEAFDALLGGADGARALQAGEGGAVRIMNLHKAKGLEAPIVVLAAPRVGDAMPRDLVVTRDRQTGEARGAIRLLRGRGPQAKAVAEPADWQEWGARDAILEGEETARLLYVAATRAGHSLHVATTTKGNSPWQPLDATLAARGVEVTPLAVHPAPGRRRADIDLATLHAEIAAADARRRQAARGTLVVQAVTEEVKREHRQEEAAPIDEGALALDAADGAARDGDGLVPRPALTLGLDALTAALSDGRQWGTAVHQALEAAVRTRSPERLTEQLDAIAWHEWPGLTDETRSALTAELQQTIDRAQQSPAWARLMRDGTVHAELAVAHVDTSDGVTVVREGVIDAIRLSDDGCFVADWKSDRVADDGWHARRAVYEAQVAMYARAVQAVTGRPVEAQVVRVSG